MTKRKSQKPIKVELCVNCHRGFQKNPKEENLLMSIIIFSQIISSEDVDISEEQMRRIEKQLGIIDRAKCAQFGEQIKLHETSAMIMENLEERVVCGFCENLFWKMWLVRLQDAGKPLLENH